jgi:hypothetical protein
MRLDAAFATRELDSFTFQRSAISTAYRSLVTG